MECSFLFYFSFIITCSRVRVTLFVLRGEQVFFSFIEARTELWSLKDNLYYGNLGCV